MTEAFADSCLDPSFAISGQSPAAQIESNPATFTTGGSWPRDVWAASGLGATLDASVVETGSPLELVDLCTILCVLGINDPWVKLKQLMYLLSPSPHHVTIRLGCDLYYRVARRLLRCFDDFGEAGDFVVNLRQCNGSDAVELGLHAAWTAAAGSPARRRLATFRGSYHGENLTASLISDHQPQHGSGRLLVERAEDVVFFPSPRCGDGGYLTAEALATLASIERDADKYFAVVIEPIQWRESVHTVPLEFLRRLREICTQNSICLIFDEIHNGFGYTGTISFAGNCGIVPDISAMSKGLTAGHGSLAIMVAKKQFKAISGPFAGKSNASDMLSLVAIDAVLDRLLGMAPEEAAALPEWLPPSLAEELRTGLLTTAYPRTVAMINALFDELRRRFPSLVGRSTGMGLVRGLVINGPDGRPSEEAAAEVAKRCLVHGVYVRQAGTAIFVKPSLTLRQSEADAASAGLSRTFAHMLRARGHVPAEAVTAQ
ncbi:aminotransferase class III-fold pyridoxal phosphate-dependent enzyme [Actinoplanes flavus]|uniref:Diaminobutyrate--2-oxoglutarate transaminase n=1 Tax=Actinoplanes flavus TaxID=2820290 RepID=A0ABS3USI6_9ACTN|nr:aminotransferase class III-fold pyridoxal phosphate-dependent enzyme [Actinoplanes flavus]MBO3741524.1 aminotransferase class III-fold pyridoxal phosphate-dependent enzyme [Actinoplanes flavus]